MTVHSFFSYAVWKANQNKWNKMWADLKVASLFKTKTKTKHPQKTTFMSCKFSKGLCPFSLSTDMAAPKLGNTVCIFEKDVLVSAFASSNDFSFKVFQSICLLFRLSNCKTQRTGGGIAGASEDVDNRPWLFCTPFWRNNSIARGFRWICLPFLLTVRIPRTPWGVWICNAFSTK